MEIEPKETKNLGTIAELKDREDLEKRNSEKNGTGEELIEKKKKSVSFFKLEYAHAEKPEKVLIAFACLGSLIAGASMPLISLLLGKVINQFDTSIDPSEVPELVQGLITNFLVAGIGIFIGSFMMVFFWTLVGRRLIDKINSDYFRVIMKQEQGWFDQSNMFEFATKVQVQIKTIENGVFYFSNIQLFLNIFR